MELLILLVALCAAEFVHSILELWGIQQKVQWVEYALDDKPARRWPIHIDSSIKTALLHGLVLVVASAFFYALFALLDLAQPLLVALGIVILLVNYIYVTWRVDIIHRLTRGLIAKARSQKRGLKADAD